MDSARQHFLPGSVFAADQNSRAGVGNRVRLLERFPERVAGAYQATKPARAHQFITQTSVLNFEPAEARRLVHNVQNFNGIERLFEKAVSATLDRFPRSALIVGAGDHHYLRRRVRTAGSFDNCQALACVFEPGRQVQIGDYHIDGFLLQKLHGFGAASCLEHAIDRVERPEESATNRLVVVYYEDCFFESSFPSLICFTHLVEFHPSLRAGGSTTLNVVPTPSCEATVIDPPLATTTSRQV